MPSSSPSTRPSLGWSRMWTSSGGSSPGGPCRRGSRLGTRWLVASSCRRSRVHRAPTPRTPPVTPIGGGMGSGSRSGTRQTCHSRCSPVEGRRGGTASRGALPAGRTSWRSLERSSKSWCSRASTGCGCSTPSSTEGSLYWWKGRGRCGCTPARWTPIARRQTKSGADSTGCCD